MNPNKKFKGETTVDPKNYNFVHSSPTRLQNFEYSDHSALTFCFSFCWIRVLFGEKEEREQLERQQKAEAEALAKVCALDTKTN